MKLERVTGGACGHPFPVYEDLSVSLQAAHGTDGDGRNATVAHVLGTCAGYAPRRWSTTRCRRST